MSERWQQVEELCHAVLARPGQEREAFLAEAAAGDEVLQREVASLIAQESCSPGFLSSPAAGAWAVPDHTDTLVGRRLGSYSILSLLGIGGMGEVYRAHDDTLGREVAIKVLPASLTADPERRVRLEREARLLAALNHPHVGAIYGLEEVDGVRALILELVEGDTLAERISAAAALPARAERTAGPGLAITDALAIARQIAAALDAAHGKGIVHRDLKPANIKITPDGTVKVLDFGLAKAATSDDGRSDLSGSREGAILGTAAYMSPEQARGQSVDKRGDIWAFGCVLYEMLTAQPAFPGETISDTIAKILEREPDWSALPAATPPALRRLIRRCLTKDQRQRLRDIGDIGIEVDDIGARPTRDSDQASTSRRLAFFRSSRLPWIVAGALAAGLALMISEWAPWRVAAARQPLRLRADLGGDESLVNSIANQYGDAAILSPDGAVLVFVAQKAGTRTTQLYVRRLNQLQAAALPGTEGALAPFFSPDGQWVGFSADFKLKKVAVNGGASAVICDIMELRGASWGEDGTIVFSLSDTRGMQLRRVSSEGGLPEPIVPYRTGEPAQLWPQILPGGKAVLYTSSAVVSAYNSADLAVQPLAGGPMKIVQRGGFHGRYIPTGLGAPRGGGHLVYVHDGTLFAVPFDLDRLEAAGPPVPVLENLASNSITGGAQFSVSATGTLVYLPGPMTGAAIPLDWMNRDGQTSSLRATRANWLNPRFSPDGRRIALEIREGPSDIWIYEWERDVLTRLTADSLADDGRPAWTPDGERIVFASARGGSRPNLYWQRADGTGDAQRLTESASPQVPGSWHPGGRFLAFEEDFKVMILPIDGDETSGWTPGLPYPFATESAKGTDPMFSPDGRWLAYMSNESGAVEIHVRPFPGPGGKSQVSAGGGQSPTWSRTRPELYYAANGRIMVSGFRADDRAFRADKARPLSDLRHQTRGTLRMFDLHPDGERFVLAQAARSPVGGPLDPVVFIFNFFDELRRIAPAR